MKKPQICNQLTSAMDYYPFGKILREYVTGQAERFLTSGNERDPETDFDYRNARFYDAEIGRFLSVDPLTSEMPEWSPYNFVFSNPIRFVDPRGLAPEWEEDGEGNLIAEENDNLQSLAEYLNISYDEAYGIYGNLDNWIDANGQKAVSGVGNIKGFRLKIPSVRNLSYGGDHFLKDLTDITGWASTIRTKGEMDWNSMTKHQQQKVAYNRQKSLKSNGTRMYTKDIKANINGNFRSLNYKLGAASGALIIADVYMKGEIRPSHVVNGIMTGVGLTGWGSPVAGVYFLTDLGMGLFYDGGLSGYIDDTWGSPLYDF